MRAGLASSHLPKPAAAVQPLKRSSSVALLFLRLTDMCLQISPCYAKYSPDMQLLKQKSEGIEGLVNPTMSNKWNKINSCYLYQ